MPPMQPVPINLSSLDPPPVGSLDWLQTELARLQFSFSEADVEFALYVRLPHHAAPRLVCRPLRLEGRVVTFQVAALVGTAARSGLFDALEVEALETARQWLSEVLVLVGRIWVREQREDARVPAALHGLEADAGLVCVALE